MEKTGLKPIDELVRRAIIGDGAAFTELWDTNIESLRAYLAGTVIRSYDPSRSKFSTWLRAIARNTALDTIEAEERSSRKFVSIDDGDTRVAVIDNMGDGESTPLDSIIKDEDEEKLGRYIAALPELYREVASKRLIEGLQYKEIADETGLALNTVRTRIRRAKALIDNMKADDENDWER